MLQPTNAMGKDMRLQDYHVKPFTTVHLMVLLYAIPEHFNHVIFDLHWGYPSRGADFLDATCLIYSGKNFKHLVDYEQRQSPVGSCVQHSGTTNLITVLNMLSDFHEVSIDFQTGSTFLHQFLIGHQF